MIVKASGTSLLHVCYPLPLYRPGVCNPHVGAYVVFSLLLQQGFTLLRTSMSQKEFLQVAMLVLLSSL